MSFPIPPSTADYLVGPIIGQGAFAQVHYAKHKESQRKVAIKVIDQSTIRKYPKLLAGIRLEQRILSSTLKDLEFVTQLGSSFYDSNCLYLVMELCEGGDLQDFLERCQVLERSTHENNELTDKSIRHSLGSYLFQIQQAIDSIHAKRVVHCDIKPANVLLSSDGRKIKLGDFGSALDLNQSISSLQDSLRGTTEYSPPELIRNVLTENPQAIDYWSFGCLAFAMYSLSGRSPFHREGFDSLTIEAILEHEKSRDPAPFFESLAVEIENRESSIDLEGNHLPSIYSNLLHPDVAQRAIAFQGIQSMRNTDPERMKYSSVGLVHPPPEPKWQAKVQNCELQDGALGWAVFLL